MIENRDLAMGWYGLSEGGYVNDPDDTGGPTNHGVTERVWHAYQRSIGVEPSDVRGCTQAVANLIFAQQYHQPVWFDRLPSGLDYTMGDFSINSGPSRAVMTLQQSLNDLGHKLIVDGHMGLLTLAVINAEPDVGLVISAVNHARLDFMKRLKNWWKYKNGWTRRVMGEEHGAQTNDTGVIDRSIRMAHGATISGAPEAAQGKADGNPVGAILALIKPLIDFIVTLLKGLKK